MAKKKFLALVLPLVIMTALTPPVEDGVSSMISSLPFARGRHWPPFHQDWDSQLDSLSGFEPRPDDIFVISYPKCGHHWSHEFLSMIISAGTNLPEGMGCYNSNV